jgi:hypothetical protein
MISSGTLSKSSREPALVIRPVYKVVISGRLGIAGAGSPAESFSRSSVILLRFWLPTGVESGVLLDHIQRPSAIQYLDVRTIHDNHAAFAQLSPALDNDR